MSEISIFMLQHPTKKSRYVVEVTREDISKWLKQGYRVFEIPIYVIKEHLTNENRPITWMILKN